MAFVHLTSKLFVLRISATLPNTTSSVFLLLSTNSLYPSFFTLSLILRTHFVNSAFSLHSACMFLLTYSFHFCITKQTRSTFIHDILQLRFPHFFDFFSLFTPLRFQVAVLCILSTRLSPDGLCIYLSPPPINQGFNVTFLLSDGA